jgi:hypothetical protein
MPRATKALSGASKEKYFRDLFAAEPGVPPPVAARLTETCSSEIAHLRVKLPIPRRAASSESEYAAPPQEAEFFDVSLDPGDDEAADDPASTAPQAPPPHRPPFDPYAFSVVAVLKKSGREALMARLLEIASADDLHRLADAQHLGLAPDLGGIGELRLAIVAGAEQRIADRRAAAS